MANPSVWADAGWGVPTPHQVLAGVALVAMCALAWRHWADILRAFASSGWGAPTPYQLLGALMLIAACVAVAGVGPSWLIKVCAALSASSGIAGIASAKNHLSPQVLRKLGAFDARALAPATRTTSIYAAAGSDINVKADVIMPPGEALE